MIWPWEIKLFKTEFSHWYTYFTELGDWNEIMPVKCLVPCLAGSKCKAIIMASYHWSTRALRDRKGVTALKSMYIFTFLIKMSKLLPERMHQFTLICMMWKLQKLFILEQGLTNFSCIEPDSKYFRLCGLCDFCHNYSTLLFKHESSHRQFINKWTWLFAIKLYL